MNALLHFGLVALGSALGGMTRYGAGLCTSQLFGLAPHWGTMFINVTGSLFLGWFSTMLAEVWSIGQNSWLHGHVEECRLLVAVGFTGGYTTFSSFEGETYGLFRDGTAWIAIFYVTGSVFLGLVGFRLGMLIAGAK